MFVCGFVVNQNRPINNMPSSGKASSSVLVYQKRTFANEMGVALKRGNPRSRVLHAETWVRTLS